MQEDVHRGREDCWELQGELFLLPTEGPVSHTRTLLASETGPDIQGRSREVMQLNQVTQRMSGSCSFPSSFVSLLIF